MCNPIELPFKFDISCSPKTSTYKSLIKVTGDSRKRGKFTFNEMKLYAYYGIEKKTIIQDITRKRFLIMFIDEAQDTKNRILGLVNQIYNNSSENEFYQAYGDSNQAIFNSYENMEDIDVFPRNECLEMRNSKRFSNSIANLANGVALDEKKMSGDGGLSQ